MFKINIKCSIIKYIIVYYCLLVFKWVCKQHYYSNQVLEFIGKIVDMSDAYAWNVTIPF